MNDISSIFPMRISSAGLNIIKEFENYEQALPDGSCAAYRCVVGHRNGQPVYDGKWTIGWGCTNGITQGMIWTRKQAEDGLRKEIEASERAVTRLVTVDMNQNQFDALVSFEYNVGDGGLAGSSVLRRFNAGDPHGAASAFSMWVNSNGVRNVPGLVRRRAMESALFLTPVRTEAAFEPQALVMPQKIDQPTGIAPPVTTELGLSAGGLGGLGTAMPEILANSAPAGKFSSSALIWAVVTHPLFWAGMIMLFGAVTTYLWRRKHAQ